MPGHQNSGAPPFFFGVFLMVYSHLCWQCSNKNRKCREHINTLGKKDKLIFLMSILEITRENYSLWFLPFCPFALLSFCPFALTPLPLPPSWFFCSFKFWRLSREDIVCICFHISVHVQISSTLLMLLLSAQMTTKTFISKRQTTSMPFLAAIIEALSKHLKAWMWARSRCRLSWDLRI